ncbi:MAG: PAS domain S-box protein [Deltaproteobacteria bacterium]|nr:PAS domain S-box protein [Deltaproteobacteria bacterium]
MAAQNIYQTIVETIHLGAYICDSDQHIQYINPAAERITGWKAKEVRGRKCFEVFGRDDGSCEKFCPFNEVFSNGRPFLQREMQIRNRAGEPVQLRVHASSFREDGQGNGAVFVFEDISLRKKNEEQRRLLSAVVEQSSEGVAVTDLEGNLVFINHAFADMHGYTPEELEGKHLSIFHTSDQMPSVEAAAKQIVEEESFSGEIWHVKRDGTVFPTLMHNTLLRDVTGAKVGMIGTLRDITDRRQSEDALRRSEERNRAMLNAIPDLMFRIDKDGVFLDYNAQNTEDLAMPPEAFLGKKVRDVFPEPFADQVMSLIDTTLATGQIGKIEYQMEVASPNSGHLDFEGRFAVVDKDEVLIITRDITEQKRAQEAELKLEAQIQHAQKLESLGVLSGGIAHDFNNLLTGILGNNDLALMKLPVESPARPHIEDSQKTAHHLAELTNQMLAYSGRGKFLIQSLNLTRLIQEMKHLLQLSVSKKTVLRYHLTSDLPSVEADASQLRQVVMNLVINASEAITDNSGIISVSTGIMEADRDYLNETYLDEGLPEGNYVFLEVSDTGAGMDEETRLKVFDPFFTTKFTGRGLGLAAVLGVVRGHKGAIKISGEQERGTTFKVLLPTSDEPAGSALSSTPITTDSPGRSGTILVVDDEETVRSVAKMFLERVGFSVITANDGREAVKVFKEHNEKITAVLLDLTMPHMDGKEALKWIRRVRHEIPVILSSGYHEHDATTRFEGMGLAGFVKKPYKIESLLKVLYEVLDSLNNED